MATEFVSKEQAAMEFAALTGEERKDAGMKKAEDYHNRELEYAQWLAGLIGTRQPVVTVDDVREAFSKEDRKWTLGNAAGSIFKGKNWEFVGWQNAKHPEAHARPIRMWRLKW